MSKERFLRIYAMLSVLVGLYFLVIAFLYSNAFPHEMYGTVEKTLFEVTLLYNVNQDTVIFNTPLIVFFVFTILNSVVFIAMSRYEKLENNPLEDLPTVNTFLTLILVLGQVLIYIFIPDQINGLIKSNILFFKFPRLSNDIVTAVNITFLLSFLYIGYNAFAWIKTMPEELELITEFDEEEFIKNDDILKEIKKDYSEIE